VKSTDLAGDKHEVGSTKDTIRFRVPPEEVKQRGPRGSVIWLKVAVNAHGDVTDVRMWQNSTGKKEMTELHSEAVKKAKFYPMMDSGGMTAAFNYDYKVQY
jgi:TonB family protein